MKILLTGATGYIARRLLPVLIKNGQEVICCVRDKSRMDSQKYPSGQVKIIEVNFLDKESLSNIPENIDAAYYLIHSMSSDSNDDFEKLETISANNFKERIQETEAKQVIYLGGIVNEAKLSKHLKSRKNVESILASSTFSLTALRAGIIVGSGSASFEIIRDLVEKLPLMITPRWLETKSQPIAIKNVIEFLSGVLLNEKTYGNTYDIGGPVILTYKQMLLKF
ncbi:MAG: NAD(P)H-binding protein, partial [Ignavibacteriaceae bacterium]